MAFGDWIRGAFAQVNPFDGGKNFRTYNPKKKREDEEPTRFVPPTPKTAPFRQPGQQVTTPRTQKPQNVFQDINKSLTIPGSKPNNQISFTEPNPTAPRVRKYDTELSATDKKVVDAYKSVDTAKSFKESRRALRDILDDPNHKQHDMAKRVAPHINMNPTKFAAEKTIRDTKEFGKNLAMTPVDVAQSVPKAFIRARNQVSGKKESDIGGFWGKVLNAENNKVGDFTSYGKEARQGVSSIAGKVETGDSKWDTLIGAGLGVLDATPLFGALAGLRTGAKYGTKAGINRATGSRNLLKDSDAGGVPEAEVSSAVRQAGSKQINVKQPRDIPIDEVVSDGTNIDVRNTGRQPRPIVEVSGDTPGVNRVEVQTPSERARQRFEEQPTGRPDRGIEGLLPGRVEDTTLYTKYEIDAERKALDDALANGELNKTQYKAANKALDELPVADAGGGKKIVVKESIPIKDQTEVPTALPETPGQTRVMGATAPNNTKSAQVAAAQIPVRIPEETQKVLDNPKQYTKRQAASARNQLKLARQMAKAQEQTAEALARIENASPNTTPRGSADFAPTGKFKDSPRSGAYETVSHEAEIAKGRREMKTQSAQDLIAELDGRKSIQDGDQRKIEAAIENLKAADPEGADTKEMIDLLKRQLVTRRRRVAQILALSNRVLRKNASSDSITGRWERKMYRAVDSGAISESDLSAVQKANDNFVAARDNAARLEEQYKTTRSKADLDAFEEAKKAAEKADIDAKTTEVKVANRVIGRNANENGADILADLEKEAELNMMDHTTASQLIGPATGMRNLYGAELAGIENRLFANTRAKITNRIFGENVGGFSREGARMGREEGAKRMVGDAARRTEYSGWNPFKHARNFATTLNSLGESSLYSQKISRMAKYYENQLKDAGVSGEQLKNDTRFLTLTDPDNVGPQFMDGAMRASGLSGIYQKSQQIEANLSRYLAERFDMVLPPRASNTIANGITRIALGYPTATGNFIYQSGKRAMLGAPSFGEMAWKLARGDKQGAAFAFDKALKEAGTGAAVWGAGAALSSAGLISGFYPDDPEERAEWEREGKSELSIKIGGAWYPIPQGFGMLGLPLILGAVLEEEGPEGVVDLFTNWEGRDRLAKLLPPDQLYGVSQVMFGDSTKNQDKAFVASTIRSLIPAGSFLNQTAKGLDETANDTTTRDFWRNVFDQVVSGIPGQDKFADIPDKTADNGAVIKNPNLLQVYSGATTAVQPEGEARTAGIASEVNSQVQNMADLGAFSDQNLRNIITNDETRTLYDKIASGGEASRDDIEKMYKSLTKGVSADGTDTTYLEKEQYDTNLTALQLKKQLMETDPTTKPSSLKKIDIAIKRGEVYRDNEIPYDLIKSYQDTNLTEWRDMEEDDPQMYQTLWAIDELMTKNGVSYAKGKLDKQKFYAKESRSSRGGSGSGSSGAKAKFITDFGTLGELRGAPSVQQYDTIDQKSGSVPVVRVKRPNIVHKITSN